MSESSKNLKNNYDLVMHSIYYQIAPTNDEDLKYVNENEDVRLNKIKSIVSINNIDINKVEGWTSFFSYAIFFRQEKIASYLLRMGADMNYIDCIGLTPLNYLCTKVKLGENNKNDELTLRDLKEHFIDKEMYNLLNQMLQRDEKLDIFYRRFNKKSNEYEPYLIYQSNNHGYDKIFNIITKRIRNMYEDPELYKYFCVEIHEFDSFNSIIRTDIHNIKKKEILLDYILADDEEGGIEFLKNCKNPFEQIRYQDMDSQTVLHWALYKNYHSVDNKFMFKIIKIILEIDCKYLKEDQQAIYAVESIRGINSIHISIQFDDLKTKKYGKEYKVLSTFLHYCINNVQVYDIKKINSINQINFNRIFSAYPIIDKKLLLNESKNMKSEILLMNKEDIRHYENSEKKLLELIEQEENQKKLEENKKIKKSQKKAKRREAERKAKFEAQQKAKLEAEQKAKLEAEIKAKLEAEKKAKLEAEQKAKFEAEQKAKFEAEQKAKVEAKKKAEIKAKFEAEQKAKFEAEQKAKLEVEKVKFEAEKAKNEAIQAKNDAIQAKNDIEKIRNELEHESCSSDNTDNESIDYQQESNIQKHLYEQKMYEQKMYEQKMFQYQMFQQQMFQQQIFDHQMYNQYIYEQQIYQQQMNQQENLPKRLFQPTPTIYYS